MAKKLATIVLRGRGKSQEGFQRIVEYLSTGIKEHAFDSGERLPTERELAEQFKVSRAATRRALGELEAEGLILRHVGRGTFVRPSRTSAALANLEVLPEGSISPSEYIESRLRFEPQFAWLVVSNASVGDFDRMEDCLKRGEAAAGREEYELWDAAFHQAIASATHNKIAIRMYEMIHAVRHEQAMWGTVKKLRQTPEQRTEFQREHRGVFEALKSRNPDRANELMVQHIRATRRRILDF